MSAVARSVSFICFALLVVGVLLFGPHNLAALAQGGQAFSISPPLLELKADPGQTVTAKIKLTNVSAGELLIKTQLNDFGAKNETGEPNIIFEDDQSSVSHSLRQWISSPEPFILDSKETKTLEIPITPPPDAEPGGHYAVVRFTGSAPELEESGVALSASIGSLVLLQVSGAVDEKMSLVEFFSGIGDGSKTGFFESGPVTFSQRIQNEGNVHVKPTGTIEIFNSIGQKIETLRVNGDPNDEANPAKSVLPNSIRRFDQTWNKGWGFGRYTAQMKLTYGQDNKEIAQTITFWIIPYKLLIGIVVVGTGLFFGLRYGVRRYNQHIISKASGGVTTSSQTKFQINKKKF